MGVATNITPMASKNGMDAHIRKCHTKKALVCSFCMFSTYNYDSLNRHAKDHNYITSTFFVQLQLPQEFFVKLNYVLFYWGG